MIFRWDQIRIRNTMSEEAYNSSNALYQMDWLTLAPMPVKKWFTKVSKHEHASLLLNRYIMILEYNNVFHVKITERGRRRLVK